MIGHEEQARQVAANWAMGRMHHAWLLWGPPGIGKAGFALRVARWVLAGGPASDTDDPLHVDPNHPAARLVAAGSHPDLHSVVRQMNDAGTKLRGEIVIDQMRHLDHALHLTTGAGGWRVAIIDPVDDVNRNAINAILKLLEEPPRRTLILLVSNAPGGLLPTIRSRCRRLGFAALDPAAMRAVVGPRLPHLKPAELEALIARAGGSPGRALALAEDSVADLSAAVGRVLHGLPSIPVPDAHALADSLSRPGSEDKFLLFMRLLRDDIALRAKALALDQPDPVARTRPLAEWGGLWERLGHLARATDAVSLDRKQAVLSALEALKPGATLGVP